MTSPDLTSPHASKGGAVQMTATLKTRSWSARTTLRVGPEGHSASHSSGVRDDQDRFRRTAGFGGNIGVPDKAGGTVGATVGYSARTAESVNAGTSSSHKSGIGSRARPVCTR